MTQLVQPFHSAHAALPAPTRLSARLPALSLIMSARLLCSSRALACPAPASACARWFSVASVAPASRPSAGAVVGGGVNPQLAAAMQRKLAESRTTPEQEREEYYRLQRKNAALGIGLAAAVGAIWAYSVHVVNDVKDTFTSTEGQQIVAELEAEDRKKAASAQQ